VKHLEDKFIRFYRIHETWRTDGHTVRWTWHRTTVSRLCIARQNIRFW